MTARPVPPLGLAVTFAMLIGMLAALRLPLLPPGWSLVLGMTCGVLAWYRGAGALRLFGAAVFGVAWVLIQAQGALSVRLPAELQGEDIQVEGRIVGLPERRADGWRFALQISDAEPRAQALRGHRVRLNTYAPQPELQAGEQWQFVLRLRRPRGVLNPGGYDFERVAMQQRLAATGYVRAPEQALKLAPARGLDAWRDRLARAIGPSARFVRALALGDTRELSARDWEVLRSTGLTHLIAISGFHVGLLAGFGALLMRALYWLWPSLGLRWPRPQAAALAAFGFAALYAAAAGFALPTVRTLLMIGVVALARSLRRAQGAATAFALALLSILVADPLAILAPGFWLSFAGVGWLLWCLPSASAGWRGLLNAQLVVTLGLLPLTVWFFAQASLAGPLANLIGIPWISLVVVPLSLFAAFVTWLAPSLGSPLVDIAEGAMELLWYVLERVADWHGALLWLPEASPLAMLLALVGCFWLLLPRGVPARWLGLVLLLPLLRPAQPTLQAGDFALDLIDVGQGLSVLVRTQQHSLLFDAGPAIAGRFDMGEAAVVPTLHALKVERLDRLVISHGDNDHAGGAVAVMRAFAPAIVEAPEGYARPDMQLCGRGAGWDWDGVRFQWLHPPANFPYLRNDSSCVLRIVGEHGSALLPGDIEAVIEQRLLREQALALRANVLVVPHHGSNTSSSAAFVDAVAPRIALFATGHGNRFGLPRAPIVARYVGVGAQVVDSADSGLVRVRVDGDGARVVARWRQARRRFWHEGD